MSEQIQTEGLSLSNIFRLFLSKLKLLILVLICGGIVGGAFGFVRTNGVNYYGTSLEFYINPETSEDSVDSDSTYGVYGAYGKHVMDNMIKLLSSEVFAEKLILNGADLPEKDVWVDADNEAEVELDLNTKIDAAQVVVDEYNAAYDELVAKINTKNNLVAEYNAAYNALKSKWQELYVEGVTIASTFDEREYLKNKEDTNYAVLTPLYNEWDSLYEDYNALNAEIETMQKDLALQKKDRDKIVNVALAAWRKTASYKEVLYKYRDAVSFSYIAEDVKAEDAADLARSFIYVNINVMGDDNKEFAVDLMARIQEQVPNYVSENMIIPSGYSGTRCIEITTTSGIDLTNPSYTRNSVIKFGLLGGAAALVLACVLLVIVDSSDKRVRNYEQIDRYLKVPLLGIIPSIDEDKINAWHENMKNGKGDDQL